MKRILALLAMAAISTLTVWGDGMIVVEQPHWRPNPQLPYQRPFAPLEIRYHHVKVKIDGQVATTSVDQEFFNPNPERLEGTYLFPVPKGAQIDKFTMDIGGKQVEAELLPADKAREIYEDIVRKMRDPALLEYADRDVFRVHVYPIEPNSAKHITLTYSEVLKSEAGVVGYVYPLNTEKFSSAPIQNVSVEVELQSDRPLKSIYSPTHEVEIKRDGPNRATVGFEANNTQPDTDFALYFAPEKDELGVNLVAQRIGGEKGYFMLMVSPGTDAGKTQVMPKDVAFVIDTSGSMAGRKIEQARKALEYCVNSLNPEDRFEVVRFSTEVEPLFNKLVDASQANRDKADDFIRELQAQGATAIDDALKQALSLRPGADEGRPFVVIFLTDGMPTIGETDPEQILAHVKQQDEGRTRIFCFGIGEDVNTHLLDEITEATRGFSQYVLPDEDVELKVSTFFAKIKQPVLANPSLEFGGDSVRVSKLYPSELPDLFLGDQLVLVGRYTGEGETAITLAGTANGAQRKFVYEVKFPEESHSHEFIPRLWATRRVGYLLDEIRLHGENAETKDEVTKLAREYGIVTPYTAYLIVEDEANRSVPLAMQTMQGLQKDEPARQEARGYWSSANTDVSGEVAMGGARHNESLKSAAVPQAAMTFSAGAADASMGVRADSLTGPQAALPSSGSLTSEDSRTRLAQYSQQTRFVAGRNFFQNANQWTDSAVQSNQNAQHVRIRFNSTEYFDLAHNQPQTLPWLALGNNVQFVLGGTVYEIYDEAAKE